MSVTALHSPESGPSIGRSWLKANLIAAFVFAATGLLMIVSDRLLGIGDPGSDPLVRGIAAAISFVATLTGLTAYALLIGGALERKLPAFPWLGWSVLHVGFGVVLGVLVAAIVFFSHIAAGDATPASMPTSKTLVAGVLFAAVLLGSVAGAIVGGLQALVLRRAARGAAAWIAWSAVAGVILALGAFAIAFGMAHAAPGRGFANDLMFEAIAFFGTLIGAVVMLPAVGRLRAR